MSQLNVLLSNMSFQVCPATGSSSSVPPAVTVMGTGILPLAVVVRQVQRRSSQREGGIPPSSPSFVLPTCASQASYTAFASSQAPSGFASRAARNKRKTKRPRKGGRRLMRAQVGQRCCANSGDGVTAGAAAGGDMVGLTASAAWRAALPLAQKRFLPARFASYNA